MDVTMILQRASLDATSSRFTLLERDDELCKFSYHVGIVPVDVLERFVFGCQAHERYKALCALKILDE